MSNNPLIPTPSVEVKVMWGKFRVNRKTLVPRPDDFPEFLKWAFFADTITMVDGHPIYEAHRVLETAVDEHGIHVETYSLPLGTEVAVRFDRGDARGRYAQFPCDVIVKVVEAGGQWIGDQYGGFHGEFVRVEYAESRFLIPQIPPTTSFIPVVG